METESSSGQGTALESLSIGACLALINQADQEVPIRVAACLPEIAALVAAFVGRIAAGGRLFYIGAGTSGRLGIVDASECPPTFGVSYQLVNGLIAGGDAAIRRAQEFAEDDTQQGWLDLQAYGATAADCVIGISASGKTPYVLGAMQDARAAGLLTGCITNNSDTTLAQEVDYPISCVVGPEVLRGSTRMKAGTAQKLILNMISTTLMIQLGRVQGDKMVDMLLSNDKLITRGTRFVMEETDWNESEAQSALLKHGSVRAAISAWTAERFPLQP
jgi:N-acetylmuramic acid 6-phosphate etherase